MQHDSLLEQLRASQSLSEQIIALKALKNDIVGHQQRREMWLTLGLIDPVVRILNENKPLNKRNGKEPKTTTMSRSTSEEEMVRFQAISVVGSLAHGGPSFIAPLHSAKILPPLLSNLSLSVNPPNIVLATLRTLNSIASSTALESGGYTQSMTTLAEAIFSKQHITSLAQIIGQQSSSIIIQNQINSAIRLISKVCREERHQQNLANGGVLDALATRLATVVVSSGCVVPEAMPLALQEGIIEDMPGPAPKTLDKAELLSAISVIIVGSKLRASQLLYSPAILAVLPSIPVSELPSLGNNYSATWARFNGSSLSERQSLLNAVETLLPHLHRQSNRHASALSSAFPPLGTPSIREFQTQSSQSPTSKFTGSVPSGWPNAEGIAVPNQTDLATDDPESPLVPWLFLQARKEQALVSLMAISVLTVLYRSGLTSKSKEFDLLIIPLLAELLSVSASISKEVKEPILDISTLSRAWALKERAPAVLASLITDNESFQKAAVDAGIIKNLSKMLKLAYEPVLETSKPKPWSPKLTSISNANISGESQTSKLGNQGLSPFLMHNINMRESTLNAIAALVPFKDEYRKDLIDQGVVPYIAESMKTHPSKPSPNTSETSGIRANGPESIHGYGTNPVTVLIAACNAIRALSRSVSILRTTLIDNGVAVPLVYLLQHPDIDVQIAATAAVCNLVLDFSPMRETISEAGIVSILCKHAHSTNAKLKLNAMWALKHLVLSTGNEVKKNCLKELGQGWLVQLVTENTEDDAVLMSRSNEAPEVPDVAMDDDVDMDQPDSDVEDSKMVDTTPLDSDVFENREPAISRPTSSNSRSLQFAQTRLAELREAEKRTPNKGLKDDIAVQEQGLDFIRNLIGGVGQGGGGGAVGAAEMVDFLFECLGQDRVFEILASKLRTKIVPSSTVPRVIPAHPEILIAVNYILVQMAGSVPRHRQLIISQTDMLKLLIPQFGHPNKEVRLALCHLVTNLTWVDDSSDIDECRLRVAALVRMGFLKKLEVLGDGDGELDVRERAKHAVWQMKEGL